MKKLGSRLSFLLLLLLGFFMLVLSWRKWPDILVDFGRELYVPWQINQGSLLYRDLMHLYGPLSQYWNALLFRVFGTQFLTLVVANLVLVACLAYLIYYIFSRTADGLVAFLASAAFLGVFAFSQYYIKNGNYNFICPYSHETVHGIFLSFLALCLYIFYLKKPKAMLIFGIGLVLGLVWLTKIEVFLAISLAILSGIVVVGWTNKTGTKKICITVGILATGAVVPAIAFFLYFASRVPVKEALGLLFTPYQIFFKTPMPSNLFYRNISGLDQPSDNIYKLVIGGCLYMFIIAVSLFLSFVPTLAKSKNAQNNIKIFILFPLLLLLIYLLNIFPLADIFRPLPLVTLTVGVLSFFRLRGEQSGSTRSLAIFVFSIFSFILLMKMVFNAHLFHYGFVLGLPSFLLLVVLLVYYIPLLSERYPLDKEVLRIAGVAITVMIIIAQIKVTAYVYSLKTFAFACGSNTIFTNSQQVSNMGPDMQKALLEIKENLKSDETFMVLPEGVILNFLSGRKNPTPFFEFNPPTLDIFGEDRILGSMKAGAP
ncbi:MAG: hypothetical protein NT033_09765, partial [Candidatus Omnitrophica bacterium]|nr:hypothetical protein [Candidatus Omnitrophota bacterium]